jgi:outer membrane protein OmpA-like peptidoglycan-associated protein
MENVMEMVQGPLMGEVFDRIGRFFHESPEGVKRGFESAVPLSMAGLAERASTQEGAQELLSTLQDGQYPHLDASQLGRAVADPSTAAGVARSGEGFVSRLFGNNQRGVVEGLASNAGVSSSSASKLLGLAMPMVLGFVGKQAASRNLDASGLRGFLTSQRKEMGNVLPGSLSRLVGGAPEAQPSVSRRAAVANGAESAMRRPAVGRWLLLPFAALIVLALVWHGGARRHAPRAVPQTQHSANVVSPQTVYAGNLTALSQALSGAQTLPQRFVLGGLAFRPNSAEIDPGSAGVLDGVAQLMTAYPGARIQVEGQTDNTGTREASERLSHARAESTRTYLMSKGIGSERIEALRAGAARPTAPSDEQGAENGRTALVLLQR